MEYTVNKLAQMAGVSTRTLRYYDEIGILKPARINSSGYRIYGQNEVDSLQQVMFYRELGVSLDDIKAIITSPAFDAKNALEKHREHLIARKNQLEELIQNIEKTILNTKGVIPMNDKEKFTGFKQKLVDDNEQKYGKEVREKYGSDVVEKSNQKFMNMSQEDYEKITALEKEIHTTLAEAFKQGNPSGELAQKAVDLHRQWLSFYWPDGHYSKEAHAGLGQMYVDDPRFTAYYDKETPGTAVFLRDAIDIYVKNR